MSINRETAIRNAYYQALNGNISYNGVNIPLTDSITNQGQNDAVYIVMTNQTSVYDKSGGFQMLAWESTINLMIVSQQAFSVSKDILDAVSEQIENIIIPSATTNGLVQQSGWQINNVLLRTVEFKEFVLGPTTSIIPKILVFWQKIVKQ